MCRQLKTLQRRANKAVEKIDEAIRYHDEGDLARSRAKMLEARRFLTAGIIINCFVQTVSPV